MKHFVSILICCGTLLNGNAQTVSLDSVLSWAIRNNPQMKVATLETSRQAVLTRGSSDVPKTDVSLMYGQYNSIQKNDNNILVEQAIPFPTVWSRQKNLNKALLTSSILNKAVTENSLQYEVAIIFNQLLYLKARDQILSRQDSLMRDMHRAIDFQYKAGESTLLARSLAETRLLEIQNALVRNNADRQIYMDKLRFMCRKNFTDIEGEFDEITSITSFDSTDIQQNPLMALAAQEVSIAQARSKLEVARWMPDIRIGYFTQTLIGVQNIEGRDQYFGSDKRFHGFQLGLSIPLWYSSFNARVKASVLSEAITKEQHEAQSFMLQQQYYAARQELAKNINSLSYYRTSALQAARLLQHQSELAFKNGEIDYKTHLLNLQQVLTVEQDYLTTQYEYNQNMITINYLRGGQQK